MKNYIYIMPGGGIFSRFLQCGVQPLIDKDFDNVYLTLSPFEEDTENDTKLVEAVDAVVNNRRKMQDYGIDNPYEHIMGYVLDQKTDHTYTYGGYLGIGTIHDRNNPIEESPLMPDYKRVLSKIHIKNEIKSRVHDLCKLVNIGPRILGVHVRMTTMAVHINSGNYPPVTFESYCNAIDQELATGRYDGIYVATDNVESLVKMEQRYGNIIRYYPNLYRMPTEQVGSRAEWAWEYEMFFYKRFWQESFMEAMTLAQCGGLICTDSNFSNAALVFSNNIKNVRRV